MSILDEIIQFKEKEVADRKALYPVKLLEKSIHFEAPGVSLKTYIRREDKVGIIAEFKRKSPSKGMINSSASVEQTSIGYMQAGASGLSVLTDEKYFGGKSGDLEVARAFNYCPILRKDFIIDEYQIIESKSLGADAILLIAAALSANQIKSLGGFAHNMGLEVLLEVHNEDELKQSLCVEIDLLGVNNRNLRTFETNVETSKVLASQIPDQFVKISESGINDPCVVVDLMKCGFEGFLIGEHFMHQPIPSVACAQFIDEVKRIKDET